MNTAAGTRRRSVTDADTMRSAAAVWPLFAALALLMMGNGLLGTLLGIRAESAGFATVVIGVVMAGYYLGFLFGSRFAPVIVARVGHIRVFSGLASLASAATLVHLIEVEPLPWWAMRVVYGFCQAGMYVTAESWLNERATNANRGRILSIYMVVVMGGAGIGQLLLLAGDPAGFRLFLVVSVLVSLAVVPIALAVTTAPSIEVPKAVRLRAVLKSAPLGVVGALGTGVAVGALLGMGAVYGTAVGMSPERVAVFIAAAILGAVALQWPIGALSDRISRRQTIFWVTVAATTIAVGGVFIDPGSAAILGVSFGLGTLIFPMYSLSLSHINDRLPVGSALGVSALVVFVNGLGAIAGPLLAAGLIEAIGNDGFWWSIAAPNAVIAAYALYRMVLHRDVPEPLKRAYAPIPARASAFVALLTRNNRR